MKIEAVKDKVVNYPKENEISDDTIKKGIPKKWKKWNVISLILPLILTNKSFAELYDDSIMEITGFMPMNRPKLTIMEKIKMTLSEEYLVIVSIGALLILFIDLAIHAIKSKINKKSFTIQRWRMLLYCALLILSIVCVILYSI